MNFLFSLDSFLFELVFGWYFVLKGFCQLVRFWFFLLFVENLPWAGQSNYCNQGLISSNLLCHCLDKQQMFFCSNFPKLLMTNRCLVDNIFMIDEFSSSTNIAFLWVLVIKRRPHWGTYVVSSWGILSSILNITYFYYSLRTQSEYSKSDWVKLKVLRIIITAWIFSRVNATV